MNIQKIRESEFSPKKTLRGYCVFVFRWKMWLSWISPTWTAWVIGVKTHTHACTSLSYRLTFYRMSSGNVALVLDHITDYIYWINDYKEWIVWFIILVYWMNIQTFKTHFHSTVFNVSNTTSLFLQNSIFYSNNSYVQLYTLIYSYLFLYYGLFSNTDCIKWPWIWE